MDSETLLISRSWSGAACGFGPFHQFLPSSPRARPHESLDFSIEATSGGASHMAVAQS